MSTGASEAVAPRPCRTSDLSFMIRLMALLEGELLAGGIPARLADRVRRHLETADLLSPGGTDRDLRQSINELNHRLRHTLGEYDEPTTTVPR
ncbi:hypothetical protein [Catenuloplanes atrovinosus]|uniref:Uncharacterized protein n=1 Tax=Catenuloplanes atrovinosus TaxID=137266 RepID=A0AAE3YPN9_9ACTN|nr:hypothetical protein [Catenuloplanes atrovinosus]MDR7276362.1 hypothetical protein [Catenuloplanes atrovinosus]